MTNPADTAPSADDAAGLQAEADASIFLGAQALAVDIMNASRIEVAQELADALQALAIQRAATNWEVLIASALLLGMAFASSKGGDPRPLLAAHGAMTGNVYRKIRAEQAKQNAAATSHGQTGHA